MARLECEAEENLIGVHGVDHLAIDNHVAVNVWAWRRSGGQCRPLWSEAVASGGWLGSPKRSDKMTATSRGGDARCRVHGVSQNKGTSV